MLNNLIDNVNRALGKRNMRWGRVIDAFRLKYPDVDISTYRLMYPRLEYPDCIGSDDLRTGPDPACYPPGGFLVWRMGSNDGGKQPFVGSGSPRPFGSYVVQLFTSLNGAIAERRRWEREPYRILFAHKAADAGNKTVITGENTFDYDAAVGELSSRGDFPGMVLKEDAEKYRKIGKRGR